MIQSSHNCPHQNRHQSQISLSRFPRSLAISTLMATKKSVVFHPSVLETVILFSFPLHTKLSQQCWQAYKNIIPTRSDVPNKCPGPNDSPGRKILKNQKPS